MLFKTIPCLRSVDQNEFLEKLGGSGEGGWCDAEEMLILELKKLLCPS